MTNLTFGLSLDRGYMWYWFCSLENGTMIAKSVDSYFSMADAQNALNVARSGMSRIN
jgi:uncharacterized protein YegP (UPF0339 family)